MRNTARSAGLLVAERRLRRPALLAGTALTAVFGTVVLAAAPRPASAQPAPNARPMGGQVVAGSASIANTANTTAITQGSDRAAINWQSFNVGRDQAVTFLQPSATSVTLNRVTGPDPSAIAGRISANGQVVLTNPNGVVFHQGSQVNAQSLVVSTAGISNRNFMAGRMQFDQPGKPDARIENAGTITVREAGLAALVAPAVRNTGTINARLGTVVLAGAAAHTLDMYGDGLVSIDVTRKVVQAPLGPDGRPVAALVTNTGVIRADGGTVQLTAHAADGVVQDLVRAGGRIQASSVGTRAGTVVINGTGGSVVIEGRIAADGRAPGTAGGTVVLNGSEATVVASGARISADGQSGGGTVAVGTTLARARGLGPAPAGTTGRAVLAAGSRVSADAKGAGDGGRVTVLSTRTTLAGGTVTAKGGPAGGDGGTIELSGEQGFRLTGSADTTAPRGKLGTVVLDPRDLLITNTPTGTQASPNNNVDPNVAAGAGGTTTDAYITPAQIDALNSNVRLQATRDLYVGATINSRNGSMTLEAGRNLVVDTVARVSANGNVTLSAATASIAGYDSAGRLTINGNITAPESVFLSAGTGGITMSGQTYAANGLTFNTTGDMIQAAGRLTTDALGGTAVNALFPFAVNRVNTIGADFYGTINVTGQFQLVTGAAPVISNMGGTPGITAGGAVSLTTGGLTLNASAAGQTAISAAALTLAAVPQEGGASILLTSGTKPTQGFALTTAELGRIQAPRLTLGDNSNTAITFGQRGDARIDFTATPINQLYLATSGAVTQQAPLSVALIGGSAGSVALNNRANAMPLINGLSGGSYLDYVTNTPLTVNGVVSGDNYAFVRGAGSVLLNGTARSAKGSFALDAGSGNAANPVAAAALTVRGDVIVANGATLSAGTGGIALGGTVTAPNFGLYTPAAVTQAATSTVTTGSLEGAVGSLSMTSRLNAVSGIATGGVVQMRVTDPAGDFTLVTSSALRVGSPSMAGGLFLPTGRTATLVTDALAIEASGNGARTVNVAGGSFVLAPFTAGRDVVLTAGQKPAGVLSLGEGELGRIDAARLQVGGAGGASGVPAVGNVTIGQAGENPIDLGALGYGTLSLRATGAVTQAAALGIGQLDGTAGRLDLSNGDNFIQTLAGFTTTSGDLALHTSAGLLVTGAVNAGANGVNLSSSGSVQAREDGSGMVLQADVTGGTVRLDSFSGGDSSFGILQESGVVTAGRLTGGGGFAQLTGANQVAVLGDFAVDRSLSLTTLRPLLIDGAVSVATTLRLNTAGLTQSATSTITASVLAGAADADTALTGRNNTVSGIGDYAQRGGSFALTTKAATLSFTGGALAAPAGSITLVADAVAVTAGPTVGSSMSAAGMVLFAPYTAGRRIELIGATAADGNALSINQALLGTITAGTLALGDARSTGPINVANANEAVSLAGRAGTLLLRTSGAVTEGQSPGAQDGGGTLGLTVGTLGGAVGSLNFGAGGNRIGTVADLVASGNLTLVSGLALTASGTVAAGAAGTLSLGGTQGLQVGGALSAGTVALAAAGGDLVQTAGSIAATGTLGLAAAGSVRQDAGTVSAGLLTANARSVALTGAGNQVTALGSSNAAGTFALTDARGLRIDGPLSAQLATLNVTGDLAFNGAVTAPSGMALTVSGSVTQPNGVVTTGSLSGAVGGTVQMAGNNQVTAIARFAAGGPVQFANTRGLSIAGPFSAPSAVFSVAGAVDFAGTVSVPGTLGVSTGFAVTQSGGTITAGLLQGSAASVALGRANAVRTVGDFRSNGAFALTDAGALVVAGPLRGTDISLNAGSMDLSGTIAASGVLSLVSGGAVGQSGGTISAAALTGSANNLALTAAGNAIPVLNGFTSATGFNLVTGGTLTVNGPLAARTASLTAGGALALAGTVNATDSLGLFATGAITQPGGTLTTALLSGRAASASLGQAGNGVAALGGFAVTNGFTLVDGRALTVSGPVSAVDASLTVAGALALAGDLAASGTLTLSASGATTQSAGVVTAGTLTGQAASLTLQQTGNQVATLGAFTTGGAFALADGRSLGVAGRLTAGSAALAVAGNLGFAGDVALGTGGLALAVTGAVTQTGGTITAGTLAGTAASVALGQAGNRIAALGGFTATGAFALTDGAGLTVAGPLTAASASLTVAGVLSFSGVVSVTNALTLSATGAVTQTGGTVAAGTLTGTAASVALGQTGNAVARLGAFTTTGAFALQDGTGLTVAGPVRGTDVSLASTGAIDLAGNVTASGTLDLRSGAAVAQSAGVLSAATLTGTVGSAALGQAGNAVGTLGGFASSGAFTLVDGGPLGVAGPLTAASASLTVAGALGFSGTVAVTNTLTLSATGAVTQTGGTIAAGTLTGTAASLALGRTGNAVAALGPFSVSTDLALATGGALALSGAILAPGTLTLTASGALTQTAGTVTAGTLAGSASGASLVLPGNRVSVLGGFASSGDFALSDASALSVAGTVTVGTGRTLSLASDSFSFDGGALVARGGTVALAEYTAGRGLVLGGGAGLGAGATITADTLRIGSAAAGPITIAGQYNLSGITTLDLRSGGAITETGSGAIRADRLAGSAASAVLGGANQVGTLAGFTTAGRFSLTNVQGLTVAGPLTAGDAVLTVTGPLVLAGTISAGSSLTLAVSGAVSQPGGSISTAVLVGDAASASLLQGGNAVTSLGAFNTTGDFALANGSALKVALPVTARNASISATGPLTLASSITVQETTTLITTGALTQTAGTIRTATLSGSAADARLSAAGNRVATLGAFASGGDLVLANAADLALARTVAAKGTVRLDVAGALTQTDGTLAATVLAGRADSVALGQSNAVGTLGAFTTSGGFALNNGQGLAVAGPFSAGSTRLSVAGDLAFAGTVSSTTGLVVDASGAITQGAGTIATARLSGSAASASLVQGGNQIGTLGGFVVQTDLALSDAGNLALSGAIRAPGSLVLRTGGTLQQLDGTVSAGTLSGGATSASLVQAGNQVAALGAFRTTGDFALSTGGALGVTGPVAVPGRLMLDTGGALSQAGGTVAAGVLTGRAASVSLLGTGNAIGTLGSFDGGTGLALADGTGLTVNGTVATTGALRLVVAGALSQAGGTVTATTFSGGADSVAFRAGGNAINAVAGFAATSDFTLATSRTLGVTNLTAATAALSTGRDLAFGTGTKVDGTLTVAVVGNMTGTVAAGVLTGSADTVSVSGTLPVLGAFQAPNGFGLTTDGGLRVAGPVSASGLSFGAGNDLVLDGAVSGTGIVSLAVRGSVLQRSGSLSTALVTGSVGGTLDLSGSANRIGTLGPLSAGGDIAVADTAPLSVNGTVAAGRGRTLALAVDDLSFGAGGSLRAPDGTVALAEGTPTRGLMLGGGADVPPVQAATLRLGTAAGGPISITGALDLTSVGTLDLRSAGAVSESGAGSMTVGQLAVQAGSVSLGGANRIGALGPVAAPGDVVVVNAGDLAVSGPLSGGNVLLRSGGDLVLSNTIGAFGTLTLQAAGAIRQPAGSLNAQALTGSAREASLAQAANRVADLAGFTTSGDFTLVDGRSLVVLAPVDPNVVTISVTGDLQLNSTVTGGTVILRATGAIREGAGGLVVADLLTGSGGTVALGNANLVSTLGDFAGQGGLGIRVAGPLSVTGRVSDGVAVGLDAGGAMRLSGTVTAPVVGLRAAGDVVQDAGLVQAGLLTGQAARFELGTGGGAARLGAITDLAASSAIIVADSVPVRLSGTIAAPLVRITAPNLIELDGGTIRADSASLAVQGGQGAAIVQTGVTTVQPFALASGSLRLELPSTGGQLLLNDLRAPRSDVVLSLGSGRAAGEIVAGNLLVQGSGGSAQLQGSVRNTTGTLAAQFARFDAGSDVGYTVNGCALGSSACSPDAAVLLALTSTAAALASTIRPDILTLDVLDLTVTRDREDPTLLLPNISERDY